MRSPSEALEVISAVGSIEYVALMLKLQAVQYNSANNITFILGENNFLYVVYSLSYYSQTLICINYVRTLSWRSLRDLDSGPLNRVNLTVRCQSAV